MERDKTERVARAIGDIEVELESRRVPLDSFMGDEALVAAARAAIAALSPQREDTGEGETIPFEIAEAVAELGEAEWGATAEMDADAHGRHVAESVRITAAHFDLPEGRAMHGLYLKGTETVLCHTGTSPNSPTVARALTGAWNQLLAESRARLADLLEPSPPAPTEGVERPCPHCGKSYGARETTDV